MVNEHAQLWDKCCQFIKDNITPQQYDAFFRNVTSVSFENDILTLAVPSQFFVDQLEERFLPVLGAGLRKTYGHLPTIQYQYFVKKDAPDTDVTVRSTQPSPTILAQARVEVANPFQPEVARPFNPQLDPRNTFENYCSSLSNKIARSIGESIAMNPKVKTFNPLFVYGSTGVGKTHLIQAIGIRTKELDPQARVLYVNARLFESQFTAANRTGTINSFFHFYQSIDMLIVDDIQELQGKAKTQNMFFHIFNHLQQNNKQIILSSDCPPAEMQGFEARVLNRFKWGMSVELERPDLALRRDVLQKLAQKEGLQLQPEVLDFISTNVTESIRELVGVMASLMGRAAVLNCAPDLELARKVVGATVKLAETPASVLDFETLATKVADFYGFKSDQLYTKSRKREVSDARQILMYLAKTKANMPLTAIGTRIGRTHSTVIYACNNIEERRGVDHKLTADLEAIESSLIA